MNFHEEALVKTFLEPSRQERFLSFLSKPKNHHKFTAELAHRYTRFLQPQFLRTIPLSQQNPSALYKFLRGLGAGERCWIVSEGQLDGQEMELLEALNEIVGRGLGTLISCIPGQLVYFESEDERLVLQR